MKLGSIVIAAVFFLSAVPVRAQKTAADDSARLRFQKLAAQVREERRSESGETPSLAPTLTVLDEIALRSLNAANPVDLADANRELAELPSGDTSLSEGYVIVRVREDPSVVALVANFGPSGPSAVRVYEQRDSGYALAGRIDHLSQSAFFDPALLLIPLSLRDGVFITVSGLSDEFSTGMFMAWRFTGDRLEKLWGTDLVTRARYEKVNDGLDLTYCATSDPDDPAACRRMVRERYLWKGGEWKKTEQHDLPTNSH
ncbi:MAG: hypothetical protein ACRD50_14770 [Candidatus Acidiferrales bacterium]